MKMSHAKGLLVMAMSKVMIVGAIGKAIHISSKLLAVVAVVNGKAIVKVVGIVATIVKRGNHKVIRKTIAKKLLAKVLVLVKIAPAGGIS